MWSVLFAAVALAFDPPLDAVVLLLQGPGTCAGAFVDDQGTLATAYHCVSPGGRPEVTTRDGTTAVGRVTAVDVSRDLALVVVPDLAGKTPYLEVRSEAPRVGERVWAMGHPYGVKPQTGFMEGTLRWSLSGGEVSTVGPKAVQFTAPVNPGNSGGPVVDDEGRLVAVVSRRVGGDGLGFGGRADGVAALAAGEGKKLGPLGGTVTLEVLVSVTDLTVAVGGRLEASFRDHFVLGISAAEALSPRWAVLRFGDVTWSEFEGRAALRQRFLRGIWSGCVEAYAAVGAIAHLEEDDTVVFTRSLAPAPVFGGAVSLAGNTIDVGFVRNGDEWIVRSLVVLRFPGTIWMF